MGWHAAACTECLPLFFFFFFYLNHKEKPTRALCFQRCFIGLIFLNSTSLYLLGCICCSLQKIFCGHLESLMVPCTFLTLFLLHFFFFSSADFWLWACKVQWFVPFPWHQHGRLVWHDCLPSSRAYQGEKQVFRHQTWCVQVSELWKHLNTLLVTL